MSQAQLCAEGFAGSCHRKEKWPWHRPIGTMSSTLGALWALVTNQNRNSPCFWWKSPMEYADRMSRLIRVLPVPIIAFENIVDNKKWIFHSQSGFLAPIPPSPKWSPCVCKWDEPWLRAPGSLSGWLMAKGNDLVVRRWAVSTLLPDLQEEAG